MPNYDAIRRVHRVETIYSDSETHRRLEEVRYPTYPDDPRCKALARAVNRKSGSMNDTEQAVLADFPEQGIDLGWWSRALTFAPAIANWPVKRHAALVTRSISAHWTVWQPAVTFPSVSRESRANCPRWIVCPLRS